MRFFCVGMLSVVTFILFARIIVAGPAPVQSQAQVEQKYWQDALFRPNQAWIMQYGHPDNDAQLAYNIIYLRGLIQQHEKVLRQLIQVQQQTRLPAKTVDVAAVEPNESGEPNEP